MAATCASCLNPIDTRGGTFVLAGTEVFHRSCAPNIEHSIGYRQKQKIIELQDSIARLREDRRRMEREHERQAQDHAVTTNLLAQLRRAMKQTEREIADIRERHAQEVTALQRELVEVRRLTPTQQVPEPKKDTRDDTEIRFSLLEIEPME